MPHTSRRKIPPSQAHKRLEITDSSGWTHVTTTGNVRRLNRRGNKNRDKTADPANPQHEPEVVVSQEHTTVEPLLPAEAPPAVTLAKLQEKLTLYRQRWEGSVTWEGVEGALRRAWPLIAQSEERTSDGAGDELCIVCVGLGSPSGFLRGGWVDRRSVSMYQLAALTSLMAWIENQPTPSPQTLKVYAQDPVFNTHDIDLLNSLGVQVLEHPGAFEKVSSRTILFCPGAERRHLELLLAHDPAVVFGGPLEDIDSDVVKQFVRRRGSLQLARFEEQEHAFWGMSVYYPTPNEKG
ncbi:hypothetical protein BJX61DRAFT_435650 [Aspergillus egyptiacus]|nr:hypothetical protein BJX61DRAFT_435650 [Aspergillus egyptiacus]